MHCLNPSQAAGTQYSTCPQKMEGSKGRLSSPWGMVIYRDSLQTHHHHFWQAPLRVRSAERRHQSPEWTVLSQVNCIIHIEVAGFQILLNGFHPCNTRTPQWSRPVSCGGSC